VEGSKPDAIEKFTVICANGVPRLLLPTSSALMRTAMTNFLGGRSVAGLLPVGVKMAARIGGPFSRICSNMSLMSPNGESSPLRELISNVIGRDDYQMALRVSFGRPNAKTVAMAISESGEALCYVKLGSEAMTNNLVAHESAILEQFETIDMPVIIPPRLYSGIWSNDQSVLITAALQLEPLERDASKAHVAASAMALQTKVSTSALVDSAYWRRIVECAGEFGESDNLSATVTDIERKWGTCEFDFGASHGDWTRANVGMVNGQVAAFDWERGTKSSPNGIDIAHFAIFEKKSRPFSKSLDIDAVVERVRSYLQSAGLLPEKAEIVTLLALLEMVIRFKSAEIAGVRSVDLKFGPALQEGVRKWSL